MNENASADTDTNTNTSTGKNMGAAPAAAATMTRRRFAGLALGLAAGLALAGCSPAAGGAGEDAGAAQDGDGAAGEGYDVPAEDVAVAEVPCGWDGFAELVESPERFAEICERARRAGCWKDCAETLEPFLSQDFYGESSLAVAVGWVGSGAYTPQVAGVDVDSASGSVLVEYYVPAEQERWAVTDDLACWAFLVPVPPRGGGYPDIRAERIEDPAA